MFKNNNNIDLRVEFAKILNENSIDVLYIRNNKYIRCKCYNSLYHTGDPSCSICFGNGHLTSIEKTKCFTKSKTGGSTKTSKSIGIVDIDTSVFYFKHDMLPNSKDIILITEWNKYKEPSHVLKVYEVNGVYPVRGENGRIEYYSIEANLRSDMVNPTQKTINLLPQYAKKKLSEGKRYLWPLKK